MKNFIVAVLISIFVCTSVAAQANRTKLFDFRLETRNNPPRITAATSRRVLNAVFPKYLSDSRYCKEDVDTAGAEDYLAAMRKAGQIVPAIFDTVTGSFTAAGQEQVAYLISVGECNASHADNFGSKRLAIFSGNRLVMNADAEFMSSILKKTDLDVNGMDELLMSTSDMHQGILEEVAALFAVRGRGLAKIKDFAHVYHDSCASLIRGSRIKASVIFLGPVQSGHLPNFQVENYRSRCGRTKQWKFMSRGIMTIDD